jgi:hypothetical protein
MPGMLPVEHAYAEEATVEIPRFGIWAHALQHAGSYANPYREVSATAQLTVPGGTNVRRIPLFWDGGTTWRLRLSPDVIGTWQWHTHSNDSGLDGAWGTFEVVPSDRKGSLCPMSGYPHHFGRQDGSRTWFLGETAWSLYVDNAQQQHDRAAAEHHVDVRAAQGFNVVHSMLMSELGWGNAGGVPFGDMATERINPSYWQEVDHRLAYLNSKGIVGGLVLAWGRKQRDDSEPFAWDRFPDLEAKTRYARYVAARYSAYDVYWIVAGEWNASTRWRADASAVEREYVAIGDALRAADPHGRMIGIHPGTGGVHSVREFNDAAAWISFGDYQQNYTRLHAEVLASRGIGKPVVNSEYAYYLRDARHDGMVDKPNSQSLDIIRHATWDIAMAGGYVVSGFGSTYLGGARNVGPFAVDAPQNDDWEAQIQHLPALFGATAWWRLQPRDDLVRCPVEQGTDRTIDGLPAPPRSVYWCLAEPGEQYVLYVRGLTAPVQLSLDVAAATYVVRQFSPRSGAVEHLGVGKEISALAYRPPDESDWVVLLQRA